MLFYQYKDPHVKDKTISWQSCLYHGNPHTWERWSLYWDRAQISIDFSLASSIWLQHYKCQVGLGHKSVGCVWKRTGPGFWIPLAWGFCIRQLVLSHNFLRFPRKRMLLSFTFPMTAGWWLSLVCLPCMANGLSQGLMISVSAIIILYHLLTDWLDVAVEFKAMINLFGKHTDI